MEVTVNQESAPAASGEQKQNLWRWLTRPDTTLEKREDTQRSRLLATVALILSMAAVLAYSALGIFRPSTLDDPDTVLSMVGIAGVLVAYLVNRTNKYDLAATIFIISGMVGTTFGPYLPAGSDSFVLLSILPVLFTAFFYSIRWVLLVSGINLGLHILLIATTNIDFTGYVDSLLIMFIADVTVIGYILHQQEIENLRRTQLEEANAALRESEAKLERRVEERTRDLKIAKEEAEDARERAEESDRVKSQFLASMSHELRTPLNAILNFTEMTALGMLGPVNDGQKDVLLKSLDSGRHLLSLINDVLDITKMHSGMMKLFIEKGINLHEELKPIIATAETLLKDKPVGLVIDMDPMLPVIEGDKRRIRQIMLNLVSNAAKFTEEGTVTLSVKNRPGSILMAVIDTGPGIPADQQELIFEPFEQTEEGVRHAGGTGLGLPISRRLAEAHGGELWVESTPGDGAAFYVVLPIKQMTVNEVSDVK